MLTKFDNNANAILAMAPHKKSAYECPSCGYTTSRKGDMRAHFYNVKKECPKILHDIELTEDVKTYVLCNRRLNDKMLAQFTKSTIDETKEEKPKKSIEKVVEELVEQVKELKIKLDMLSENKKNESFYQMIVEKYLGGTHKKLKCGITDVSTDAIHAEIKNYDRSDVCVGQLLRYNREDPKERLQVYLFGKPQSTLIYT